MGRQVFVPSRPTRTSARDTLGVLMDYVKPELVVLGSASTLLSYLNNQKVGPPPETAGTDPGRNPPAYDLDD